MQTTHLTNSAYQRQLEQSRQEMELILTSATARLERSHKTNERSELDASYKLVDRKFPWSCTLEEGLAMHYVIRQHQFKCGYEMATAFGFSSLFLGAALQQNGGRLTTVDCYVEAAREDCVYTPADIRRHVAELRTRTARGDYPASYLFAQSLGKEAGLEKTIDYEIGVSPEDIPPLLKGRQIDFAFIDGGHYGDQPVKDFRAVLPFLAPRCAVFFHDAVHNEFIAHSISTAVRALRSEAILLNSYYGLALVGRNLEPQCLELLRAVSISEPFQLKPFLKKLRYAIRRRTGYYSSAA